MQNTTKLLVVNIFVHLQSSLWTFRVLSLLDWGWAQKCQTLGPWGVTIIVGVRSRNGLIMCTFCKHLKRARPCLELGAQVRWLITLEWRSIILTTYFLKSILRLPNKVQWIWYIACANFSKHPPLHEKKDKYCGSHYLERHTITTCCFLIRDNWCSQTLVIIVCSHDFSSFLKCKNSPPKVWHLVVTQNTPPNCNLTLQIVSIINVLVKHLVGTHALDLLLHVFLGDKEAYHKTWTREPMWNFKTILGNEMHCIVT